MDSHRLDSQALMHVFWNSFRPADQSENNMNILYATKRKGHVQSPKLINLINNCTFGFIVSSSTLFEIGSDMERIFDSSWKRKETQTLTDIKACNV